MLTLTLDREVFMEDMMALIPDPNIPNKMIYNGMPNSFRRVWVIPRAHRANREYRMGFPDGKSPLVSRSMSALCRSILTRTSSIDS